MLGKLLLLVVALLVALVLVPGCGKATPSPTPTATPTPTPSPSLTPTPTLPNEIKIGSVLAMTGALAHMGHLISQGVKMAIEEINAAGGIAGSSAKLLLEDTTTDAKTALEAFKKLVEVDGVQVVIGPMISPAVMAIGPYASERGVVFISPSSTAPTVAEQPWAGKACFRTCPNDNFQGKALAKLILDKGFKRVAMLIMDNAYGVGIEKVAKEELDGKVDIVADIRYDPKKLDYLTELGLIKDKNPDCVLHVGFHDDGAVVYRQAMEMGLDKIQWVSAEGVYGFDFSLSKDASEFMVKAVMGTALTSTGPRYDEFVAKYKAKWGEEPSVYCDTAYDATWLVAKAIEKAGAYDGVKIAQALHEVGQSYPGASGVITFNEKGDRVSGTYLVWKVEKLGEGEYKFTRTGLIPFE